MAGEYDVEPGVPPPWIFGGEEDGYDDYEPPIGAMLFGGDGTDPSNFDEPCGPIVLTHTFVTESKNHLPPYIVVYPIVRIH